MLPSASAIGFAVLELEGVRYAVVREGVFQELCRRAGCAAAAAPVRAATGPEITADASDSAALAERLLLRRQRAGLSQAALARRADVRVETLNRIERGHTTPDFATIRKLLVALKTAEDEAVVALTHTLFKPAQEPADGNRHRTRRTRSPGVRNRR